MWAPDHLPGGLTQTLTRGRSCALLPLQLSCIDCGVVFNRQSVQGHKSCVTDEVSHGETYFCADQVVRACHHLRPALHPSDNGGFVLSLARELEPQSPQTVSAHCFWPQKFRVPSGHPRVAFGGDKTAGPTAHLEIRSCFLGFKSLPSSCVCLLEPPGQVVEREGHSELYFLGEVMQVGGDYMA
jgi:hypothetical protein